MLTNVTDKKQYIGQTTCKDIETRWNSYRNIKSSSIGRHLLNALNKYGVNNFTFKIICICFDEDCNKYEEEYIKRFNTLAPNGYNLKGGGFIPNIMKKPKK